MSDDSISRSFLEIEKYLTLNEKDYEDTPSLDGLYAAFGKVTEGMDVVDEIVNTEVIRREVDSDVSTLEDYYKQYMEIDRPVNPPTIKTITVDTFGVEYEAPTKFNKE